MRRLLSAPPRELDPETAATVDAVCAAVEGFDGSIAAVQRLMAYGFRDRWLTAARNASDSECRARIFDAIEAIVRSSGEFIGTDGRIYPRAQIGQYQGRVVYERIDDELVEILQWPCGMYASGEPYYGEGAGQ